MQAFIGRQPILDSKNQELGYELFYRHEYAADKASMDDSFMASLQVITNLITRMGTTWLLGDKIAIINVTPALLQYEFINLLPPENVVLELVSGPYDEDLIKVCSQLRSQNYTFALNIEPGVTIPEPLMKLASYLYFDLSMFHPAALQSAMAPLKQRNQWKLIAKCVERSTQFSICKEMGFHYFQGYYFSRPETISVKTIDPAHEQLIQLLNLLRINADCTEIEKIIKQDVVLPAKLFQYVNSVSSGVNRPIYSINQALMLVGYRQLYRWVCLQMISATGNEVSNALASISLCRARFIENIGKASGKTCDLDYFFIIGLFSLLDIILGTNMPELLARLSPPDDIRQALEDGTGPYGPWLEMALACEVKNQPRIFELASELELTVEMVNQAHIEAICWTEQIKR